MEPKMSLMSRARKKNVHRLFINGGVTGKLWKCWVFTMKTYENPWNIYKYLIHINKMSLFSNAFLKHKTCSFRASVHFIPG